jgi:hypothetical protein
VVEVNQMLGFIVTDHTDIDCRSAFIRSQFVIARLQRRLTRVTESLPSLILSDDRTDLHTVLGSSW